MPKDYHKGVKLQVYIPEELNDKIDHYILIENEINDDHNCPHTSKSDFVRKALNWYIKEFLMMV